MGDIRDHRDLEAWQVAMDAVIETYRVTGSFLNHFGIALGSLAELDTQLEVAIRLTYITIAESRDLKRSIQSSRRLLHGLRRAKQRRLLGTASGALVALALLRLLS
jgi:23S rRNA-intervening sequence protein